MDTSVNAANQVVSVGADIAFDADPKFFACLVRFESSSVPTKTQSEDRKSGSAGMPRPISYAVFCLKKKRPTKTPNRSRSNADPPDRGEAHSACTTRSGPRTPAQ